MELINLHISKLYRLCQLHKVDKLYLFGSFLKGTATESSDIDLLVLFKEVDLKDYFDNYMTFKEELSKLFKKRIDLIEEQTLKNPVLINSIKNSRELIYG